MSGDVHRFGSHCCRWHKPIISIFRIFLRKVIESSFWCKFISFASCARAYETWKQCQWIMRTLTCKHKIGGKNWLYLRPYLKAFPVFNVFETCREYFSILLNCHIYPPASIARNLYTRWHSGWTTHGHFGSSGSLLHFPARLKVIKTYMIMRVHQCIPYLFTGYLKRI